MARLRGWDADSLRWARSSAVIVLLAVAGMSAPAPPARFPRTTRNAWPAISSAGLEKPLADGETLSLHISGDTFAKSVHSIFGCAGCHSDIDLAKHPADAPSSPASAPFPSPAPRSAPAATATSSISGSRASTRPWSPKAIRSRPICTSCHSPHAVIKGAAEAMDTVPCKACHGDIFTAYAGSVHGVLRSARRDPGPALLRLPRRPRREGSHGGRGNEGRLSRLP